MRAQGGNWGGWEFMNFVEASYYTMAVLIYALHSHIANIRKRQQ